MLAFYTGCSVGAWRGELLLSSPFSLAKAGFLDALREPGILVI